jgi:hypothetical protein
VCALLCEAPPPEPQPAKASAAASASSGASGAAGLHDAGASARERRAPPAG